MDDFLYNFEYERRLRWAHVGCGDHSYRNVLPTFRYCPIELETVCDLRPERAEEFARVFGAKRYETDYNAVLEDDNIEVVSLVMGCDPDANVVYPKLAIQAMEAGKNVWIEKPPANSSDEVRAMMAVERATGKRVFCGVKKMFMPAVLRAVALIESEQVGTPVQFSGRYPQEIPTLQMRHDNPASRISFLDHLCHPTSIALRVMGKATELMYVREEAHHGGMLLLKFANGGVGSIHLCNGVGPSSPRERTEIICQSGGNIIIENNIDVAWYRSGDWPAYGREPDFTCQPSNASIHWRPEFSLGVLSNDNAFILGYANELNYFCRCILDSRPFDAAGTDDILHLTHLYEACIDNPPCEWVKIPSD